LLISVYDQCESDPSVATVEKVAALAKDADVLIGVGGSFAALASPLPCNTNDYNTVMLFSNNIEFGELYVNRQQGEAYHGFHAGWKQSGIGGDNGKHDVFEFLQTRCVYLDYQTDLY